MASNFQKYTNGVQMPTGIAEAGANIGMFAQKGLGAFGESLSQGLKAYNENAAKDQVLQEEAKSLGMQIQQFAAQFGDSPEHAPFAQSLQPYIEQLAKVPSMSLTQKMGAVTGVKAAFSNIGQQLQVFELMRGERLKRDMNAARAGVHEFDDVTVPTAIIPTGKLPYFYDKSYADNEAEVVRLANEAKSGGAEVDIPKVISDWRNQMKASAMSRNDIPPAVKEALVKQIEAGEGLADNVQSEDGVTDYSKEADMYARTSTSVKEQLAPQKVEPPAKPQDASVADKQKRAAIEEGIAKLKAIPNKVETISDSEFNKLVDKDSGVSRFTKVSNLESKGWRRSVDDKGKVSWSREIEDERITKALDLYNKELKKIPVTKEKEPEETPEQIQAKIDALQKQVAEGNYVEDSTYKMIMGGAVGGVQRGIDWYERERAKSVARIAKSFGDGTTIDKTKAEEIVKQYKEMGQISSTVMQFAAGVADDLFGRDLTKKEQTIVENAFNEYTQKQKESPYYYGTTGTDEQQLMSPQKQIEVLQKKKERLLGEQGAPTQQAGTATGATTGTTTGAQQEAKPEEQYTLTNQRNMSLGTTTAHIATSLESKRKDMQDFFTKKYGYIPASFEDSFKAIYPEANFKTMETPYGVFMHDGKEWKQIQMKEPKVMSNKEIAEEKSVTFGRANAQGGLEFQELVPKSGVYVRGIFAGSPTEAFKFRTEMLETANAKVAVNRLIEINNMVGESMPWNAKLWGEAKALLPQIKAGLRTDIIGVGTVSNYEQQLIEEVVADPTKFWSLESSDRAKLSEIMRRVTNRLADKPALYGLEVKTTGQSNEEIERNIRLGRAGKSKLELDFEANGGKKGTSLNWNLANKIPNAIK